MTELKYFTIFSHGERLNKRGYIGNQSHVRDILI